MKTKMTMINVTASGGRRITLFTRVPVDHNEKPVISKWLMGRLLRALGVARGQTYSAN